MVMTTNSSAISTGIRSIRCASPMEIMHCPVERTLGEHIRAVPAVSNLRDIRLVAKNRIQRDRIGQHQGLLTGILLTQSGIGDVVKREAQAREVIETITKVGA